jgi:hypothetical protein
VPGKSWNTIRRLYGPLEPYFDKTWRPGEIELMLGQLPVFQASKARLIQRRSGTLNLMRELRPDARASPGLTYLLLTCAAQTYICRRGRSAEHANRAASSQRRLAPWLRAQT